MHFSPENLSLLLYIINYCSCYVHNNISCFSLGLILGFLNFQKVKNSFLLEDVPGAKKVEARRNLFCDAICH